MSSTTASLSPSSGGNAPSASWLGDGVEWSAVLERFRNVPTVFSRSDQFLYQQAFQAQDDGNWFAADAAASKLSDNALMGHLLAQRYLHKDYKPVLSELTQWLEAYGDLPQASKIHALAAQKPGFKGESPKKSARLQGYGDSNLLVLEPAALQKRWRQGIDAFKAGKWDSAGRIFAEMANDKNVSEWRAAAAAYWASRTYQNAGNKALAERYLQLAAQSSKNFYGILAQKRLGVPLELETRPVSLSKADIARMMREPMVRRIVALREIGKDDLAEMELRSVFPSAGLAQKEQLLGLAHALDLASVQISMAKQLRRDSRPLDFALYPIPRWKPENGFTVDPALVYALMRQESGFRADASSPSGAMGLMQLMPKTASMMKRSLDAQSAGAVLENDVSEPVLNVTLGQNYIQHLLDNGLVENNLIYAIAAYNAGPGRLAEWKKSERHADDPLLFIETIPFEETRAYVMQVMTNYWIYSEMTGSSNASLYTLSQGRWPNYSSPETPVAQNDNRRAG